MKVEVIREPIKAPIKEVVLHLSEEELGLIFNITGYNVTVARAVHPISGQDRQDRMSDFLSRLRQSIREAGFAQ